MGYKIEINSIKSNVLKNHFSFHNFHFPVENHIKASMVKYIKQLLVINDNTDIQVKNYYAV
jgi:hypothetical protein